MKLSPRLLGLAAVLVSTLQPAFADVITDWNVTALGLTQSAGPQAEMRALAMTHIAMFDAVNAITRSYSAYVTPPIEAAPGSSADAAAATAAHAVLMSLFPLQKAALDTALQTSLAKVADGDAKTNGIAVGRKAGEVCIAMRATDKFNVRGSYVPVAGPGRWQPAPPAMLPFSTVAWADVTPFFLKTGGELKPIGPLAIDSAQYAREIDEVRRLGGRNSTERTADQTAAALFTAMQGGQLWNSAARAAAAAKGTTMPENARIFAIINMAASDGFIAAWTVKREMGTWRPVNVIRTAAVNPDPNWEPLLNTPAHPDYLSGHTVTSGAWYGALTQLFGGDGAPFSATWGNFMTRRYSGFTQALKEIENGRVWAGIHTRTADEHGSEMGTRIGELAVQRGMKPL